MKSISMVFIIVLSSLTGNYAEVNTEHYDTRETEVSYDDQVTNGDIYGGEANLNMDEKGYSNLTERDKIELQKKEAAALIQPKAYSKYLGVAHQTQQTDYWCGPASASMLVKYLGYNKSQSQMAGLLGTTTNGTGAGNNVSSALNTAINGSKFYYLWRWHTYSDIDGIRGNIHYTINSGAPAIINTLESPGDVYIGGHDTGYALYHFGVIGGFSDNGNSFLYLDPGAGRFGGFITSQYISARNMSYATGGRGYVW